MRNVFKTLSLMAVVAYVACSSDSNDKQNGNGYIMPVEKCIVDNPDSEFDTLSYAIGMNYALTAQSFYLDAGFDRDAYYDSFFKVLDAENIDCGELHNAAVYVRDFGDARYRKYAMDMRRANMMKRDNPNLEIATPILYDSIFTMERVSMELAKNVAGQLRIMHLPLNRHWIDVAMKDAFKLEDMSMIDSVMQISVMDLRKVMGNPELTESVATYLGEKSDKWLKSISEQEGICEYRMDETSDAVYYKIEKPGSDVRPVNDRDSLYINYSLMSCHGMLIESTEEMVAAYDKYIKRIENDAMIPEANKVKMLAEAKAMRDKAQSGGMLLEDMKFKVLVGCLKEIGEGGVITVFMPASHAPNVARGAQNLVFTNEGVVMTIKLNRVVPQSENDSVKPVKAQNVMLRKNMVAPSANTVVKQ